MSFYTITGFHDAIQSAADLGAFNADSDGSDYQRGIVELIAQTFMRGDDDLGTGERLKFVIHCGRRASDPTYQG